MSVQFILPTEEEKTHFLDLIEQIYFEDLNSDLTDPAYFRHCAEYASCKEENFEMLHSAEALECGMTGGEYI